MSLHIQYSKEIAKEIGKIAVCLPGEPLKVGDIITFPNGTSFFGRSRPLGTFKKVTSLENLEVTYKVIKYSKSPDSYQFTSKNSVNSDFQISGEVDSHSKTLPNGVANIKINFSSEGAIYFLAIDCNKNELDDLVALENQINAKNKKILWDDTYLVTSVTIAKKAFIAQSRSKNSEIIVSGKVNGIQSDKLKIAANSNLSVANSKGDFFIKDWSDDVTVFMDVIKFEQEIFDEKYRGTGQIKKSTKKIKTTFKPISAEDLLTD